VLQCVAVCCSVLQCVAAVRCSVLQCVAPDTSHVLQCVAVCCSVLQCGVVCCSVLHLIPRITLCVAHYSICNTLQHVRLIICNTLQHTTPHCNTLQHTASHCNTLHRTATQLLFLLIAIYAPSLPCKLSGNYRVAKTHNMPYRYRSFSAKEPYT